MSIRKLTFLLLIPTLLGIFTTGASRAIDPENCLLCHKYRRLRAHDPNGTLKNYYVDARLYNQSLHRNVPCTDCHIDINKVPHDQNIKPVNCAQVCHVLGECGSNTFSHLNIVNTFNQSIHGIKTNDPPAIASLKPDCKYCHLNDLFQIPKAFIPEKALDRCMNCHKEKGIRDIFIHMSHRLRYKTTRSHKEVVALCASCHGNPDFIKASGFTGLEAEAVASYKETLHYRIIQLGGQKAADCIDCHASSKIHDIRPASDPASTINPRNRYLTCQQQGCHPHATKEIAVIDTHLSFQKKEDPELYYSEIAMQWIMLLILFFLFTLMGMETFGRLRNKDARFFRWKRVPQPFTIEKGINPHPMQDSPTCQNLGRIPNLHRYVNFTPKGDYHRYSIHIVISHILMMTTFTIAALTGIPLYFHNTHWAYQFVTFCGGINVTRLVHHINAAVFTSNILYHLLVLLISTIVKKTSGTFDYRRTMIPRLKDLKDIFNDFKYFLGMTERRPPMEKFMYKQKLHYYAMIWGCSVLTLSGLCLLFPARMVEVIPFPKISFNFFRLFHADESILALLVILFWHLYNVHSAPGRFPMQWTWLNGKISRDHQIEEHYLEYLKQVEEGTATCEEDHLIEGKK